jgi:hypothetical protein
LIQADVAAGQMGDACVELRGFASEVKAQSGKKVTAAQAKSLLAAAAQISPILGC